MKIVIDHLGKPDLKRGGSVAGISKDVPAEEISPGMGERVGAV